MRQRSLVLLLVLCSIISISKAQEVNNKLLHKPFPEIKGQTLEGKRIDKKFFKNKVTLVNFMFIGCLPCMKEIGMLNQLYYENKANPDFQILGVSANTSDQLFHFNAEDTTIYSRVRRILKTDPIAYPIMPGCEKEKVKPTNSIGAECNDLNEKFYFNGYPTSFLIDKKGVVRKVFNGFPVSKIDDIENHLSEESKRKIASAITTEDGMQNYVHNFKLEIKKLLKE